ncbi:hypothetical protein BKA66DRAFT_571682 [Pyrenochaeta sp. MPI-SDFR-AT-0127]|nr:hypothetical protein BKA66DRAFT_571682 [Pyrenochaeta sp. MPI-SDFR-AT-0127]
MFATPVFISRNVLDPAIYASKRASQGRVHSISRLSTTSSEASSVDLYRTSSTSSNASTSTTASSIAPSSPRQRPQHRKTFSASSFSLPKRFQKKLQKAQPQQLQRRSEPVPTSAPLLAPVHVEETTPKPAADWQCSDLVVRCRNDVYHVDRVIMCYHSRWFEKVCAVVIAPRSSKSVIDLSSDDPEAVAAMMQYCYQLDYTERLSGSDAAVPEATTLSSHVAVFMLAERYGITGLKRVALEKFEELAGMVLMFEGNEEQLIQAIRAMYAPGRRSDANDLRRLAIQLCAGHVEAFIKGTEKTMAMVFESMDELPEFRADLFEEMASRWK